MPLSWRRLSLAVCVTMIAGCGSQPAVRSNLGTTIGQREVKASLEGPGLISSEGEEARISFNGGNVRVGKAEVLLNGRQIAELPADAKNVLVEYVAGKLTVTADGNVVFAENIK